MGITYSMTSLAAGVLVFKTYIERYSTTTGINYEEAKALCAAKGPTYSLATPYMRNIVTYILERYPDTMQDYWIAGSDAATDGKWIYDAGTQSRSNGIQFSTGGTCDSNAHPDFASLTYLGFNGCSWGTNEPSTGTAKNCIEIRSDGLYYTIPCSTTKTRYVCEQTLCVLGLDCHYNGTAPGGMDETKFYPQCPCTCLAGWSGPRCETEGCSYQGNTCSTYGTQTYNAAGVRPSGCCTCKTRFTGNLCTSCTYGYGPSQDNAVGTQTYTSGGFRPSGCCTCKTGFTGDRCNQCDSGYTSLPNCADTFCYLQGNTCFAAGTVSYNANNIRPGGGGGGVGTVGCCSCKANFTGNNCDTCVSGYGPAQVCDKEYCSKIGNNCHAEGTASYNANNFRPSGCCTCKTGFTGDLCNQCTRGYSAMPTCADTFCYLQGNTCTAAGTVSYNANNIRFGGGGGGVGTVGCCTCYSHSLGHNCETRVCHADYDCRGYAIQTTSNNSLRIGGAYPNCLCRCMKAYGGRNCRTLSATQTLSVSRTVTMSASASSSLTASATRSVSFSRSDSLSTTITVTTTTSRSKGSMTATGSAPASTTRSMALTATVSHSATASVSRSLSSSVTATESGLTESPSATALVSDTASIAPSMSTSGSGSATLSASNSPTSTTTVSASGSVSPSLSVSPNTPSFSATPTSTVTCSASTTLSTTSTVTATHSKTVPSPSGTVSMTCPVDTYVQNTTIPRTSQWNGDPHHPIESIRALMPVVRHAIKGEALRLPDGYVPPPAASSSDGSGSAADGIGTFSPSPAGSGGSSADDGASSSSPAIVAYNNGTQPMISTVVDGGSHLSIVVRSDLDWKGGVLYNLSGYLELTRGPSALWQPKGLRGRDGHRVVIDYDGAYRAIIAHIPLIEGLLVDEAEEAILYVNALELFGCGPAGLWLSVASFDIEGQPVAGLKDAVTAMSQAASALGGGNDLQAIAIIGLMPCSGGLTAQLASSKESLSPFAINDEWLGVLYGNGLVIIAGLALTVLVVAIFSWRYRLARLQLEAQGAKHSRFGDNTGLLAALSFLQLPALLIKGLLYIYSGTVSASVSAVIDGVSAMRGEPVFDPMSDPATEASSVPEFGNGPVQVLMGVLFFIVVVVGLPLSMVTYSRRCVSRGYVLYDYSKSVLAPGWLDVGANSHQQKKANNNNAADELEFDLLSTTVAPPPPPPPSEEQPLIVRTLVRVFLPRGAYFPGKDTSKMFGPMVNGTRFPPPQSDPYSRSVEVRGAGDRHSGTFLHRTLLWMTLPMWSCWVTVIGQLALVRDAAVCRGMMGTLAFLHFVIAGLVLYVRPQSIFFSALGSAAGAVLTGLVFICSMLLIGGADNYFVRDALVYVVMAQVGLSFIRTGHIVVLFCWYRLASFLVARREAKARRRGNGEGDVVNVAEFTELTKKSSAPAMGKNSKQVINTNNTNNTNNASSLIRRSDISLDDLETFMLPNGPGPHNANSDGGRGIPTASAAASPSAATLAPSASTATTIAATAGDGGDAFDLLGEANGVVGSTANDKPSSSILPFVWFYDVDRPAKVAAPPPSQLATPTGPAPNGGDDSLAANSKKHFQMSALFKRRGKRSKRGEKGHEGRSGKRSAKPSSPSFPSSSSSPRHRCFMDTALWLSALPYDDAMPWSLWLKRHTFDVMMRFVRRIFGSEKKKRPDASEMPHALLPDVDAFAEMKEMCGADGDTNLELPLPSADAVSDDYPTLSSYSGSSYTLSTTSSSDDGLWGHRRGGGRGGLSPSLQAPSRLAEHQGYVYRRVEDLERRRERDRRTAENLEEEESFWAHRLGYSRGDAAPSQGGGFFMGY